MALITIFLNEVKEDQNEISTKEVCEQEQRAVMGAAVKIIKPHRQFYAF